MPPRFIAPVPHAVTSGWGDDRSYRGGWHEGLDFGCPTGTPVRAIASGKVIVASVTNNFEGTWIQLAHTGDAEGWSSRYMHLSKLLVKAGNTVSKGQVIGLSGRTGITNSNAHLHFDLAINDPRVYPFPKPTTGWGKDHRGYIAVPAEPLVPANYPAKILARAANVGVRVYGQPGAMQSPRYAEAGAAALAIGIGGFFLYKFISG
jgi:murein DD-endopeptidase MepM/ murein hydrolase activator NlpD